MRMIKSKFINNKILFCFISLMISHSAAFAYNERDDFIDSLYEKHEKKQDTQSSANQVETLKNTSTQTGSAHSQMKESPEDKTDVPSVNQAIVKKYNPPKSNQEENDSQEGSSHKKEKKYKLTREQALENAYLNHVYDFKKVGYTKPVIRDGVVYFNANHGQAIVFCAVSHVCDIRLEKNEEPDSVEIGDKLNWIVTRAKSGDKKENFYAHIDVKPVALNIDTDLVINTNKRTYIINLKSTKSKRYFSSVAFVYSDSSKLYSNYAYDIQSTIPKESLFSYRIRGDKTTWTPVNVSTDGKKTYIELPKEFAFSNDLPSVYSLDNDGSTSIVNHRFFRNYIIIDLMVEQGELIQNVGNSQSKVIFTQKGKVGLISKLFGK